MITQNVVIFVAVFVRRNSSMHVFNAQENKNEEKHGREGSVSVLRSIPISRVAASNCKSAGNSDIHRETGEKSLLNSFILIRNTA